MTTTTVDSLTQFTWHRQPEAERLVRELVDAGDELLPSERRDDCGSNGGGGENSAPRSPKRVEDHGESEHEQVY